MKIQRILTVPDGADKRPISIAICQRTSRCVKIDLNERHSGFFATKGPDQREGLGNAKKTGIQIGGLQGASTALFWPSRLPHFPCIGNKNGNEISRESGFQNGNFGTRKISRERRLPHRNLGTRGIWQPDEDAAFVGVDSGLRS